MARDIRIGVIGVLLLAGCLVACNDGRGLQDDTLEIVRSNGDWLIVATENAQVGCFDSVRVTRLNGQVQWEVRAHRIYRASEHPKAKFCTDDFPLRYGSPPSWMTEIVAAKPLEPGGIYLIDAGPLRGTFQHP